jgi:tight adherence protein B
MILAFSLLIFLAVALGLTAVVLHRSGASLRAMHSRLRAIAAGDHRRPGVSIERDGRYSAVPLLDRVLRSLHWGQHIEFLLYQAGMRMRSGVLVLLIASFAMGGYFLGIALTHRVMPALLFMAIAGPVPYLYVLYRKGKRMKAFAQEFPDALDLLVSALRAGLSFTAAMQIVAEESPEPVRGEFAYTVEEQALGIDTREALANLSKRVDSLDLRFFVTAVILQRDTGGNLAEILENTARLIRDRFRIFGDIKTFTAQGRLTGWILTALPAGIALFTFVMTPDYFKPMLESEGGRAALWFAAFLQLVGVLVIRKIVNIKV